MTEELETLFEVSSCLENAKIPYMICGSMAVNYYATPRMTRDIDLVVEMGVADAERITRILDPDFFIDLESVRDATRKRRMFNAVHRKSLIKIDFVVRKDERFREEEFARRCQVELEGRRIWMVSPEDLLLSKLYWAKDSRSELQLRDARNLLASAKLDEVYVDRWAAVLGIEDLLAEVRT